MHDVLCFNALHPRSSHRVQCCQLSSGYLVPSADRGESADTFLTTLVALLAESKLLLEVERTQTN
jgi:hypothetical protein